MLDGEAIAVYVGSDMWIGTLQAVQNRHKQKILFNLMFKYTILIQCKHSMYVLMSKPKILKQN